MATGRLRLVVMATLATAAMLAPQLAPPPAAAHPHEKEWWLYDPKTFDHDWRSEQSLRKEEKEWRKERLKELEEQAKEEAQKQRRRDRKHRRDGEQDTTTDEDPPPVKIPAEEIKAFHKHLQEEYLAMHKHRGGNSDSGKATWYTGKRGACGKPLKGYYAASRTLPCGSEVSVRSGDHWVFVTILDRGPSGHNLILDLSKKAFRKLAPTGAGVIKVKATKLKN